MKEKFKLTEVWFKIVLLFVFSGLYILAIPYPAKSKEFPQLLAVISLIMTVISLIMDFSSKDTVAGEITDVDDTELKVLDAATKQARKKRFYQAWAIILVSTGVGFLGGFLFSTFFYFIHCFTDQIGDFCRAVGGPFSQFGNLMRDDGKTATVLAGPCRLN